MMKEIKYLSVDGETYQITDPKAVHSDLEQPRWGKGIVKERKRYDATYRYTYDGDRFDGNYHIFDGMSVSDFEALRAANAHITVIGADNYEIPLDDESVCVFTEYMKDYDSVLVLGLTESDCCFIEGEIERPELKRIPGEYLDVPESGGGSGGVEMFILTLNFTDYSWDENGSEVWNYTADKTPEEIMAALGTKPVIVFIHDYPGYFYQTANIDREFEDSQYIHVQYAGGSIGYSPEEGTWTAVH